MPIISLSYTNSLPLGQGEDTLLEEVVVEFVFKWIYYVTLHHERQEFIPLKIDVISKEGFV